MQCPDEELVRKWKEGDLSAFEMLYRRYERRVLNVAARMTGSLDDAEDIRQETFLRANRCIRGFRGGKFSTWLFRIAANLCLDHAKRRGRKDSSIDEMVEQADWQEPEKAESNPESLLMREEFARAVRLVIAAMPPHHRILLVLRHIDEMPYEEIAAVVGCSVNALGVRLHRAREIFKERMRPFLDQDGGSARDEVQRSKTEDVARS